MPKTISLSEAKARLSEIVKKVGDTRDVYTISRGGKPAGVLLSVEEYESLLETLEILSDPEALAALREARKEEKKGEFLTHEEVWGGL
jgi:antitoxin YefM